MPGWTKGTIMRLFSSRGRWDLFLGFLALVATSGCTGASATVKGKVTLDGQPVKGGTVTFASTEGKPPASGSIQQDGGYEVLRAPTGKVKITVETESLNPAGRGDARKYEPPAGQKSPYGNAKGGDDASRYVKIPEKYKLEETTDLAFEVKGGTNTHDLKLSSGAGGGGAGQ
jgi:hypothetical protein